MFPSSGDEGIGRVRVSARVRGEQVWTAVIRTGGVGAHHQRQLNHGGMWADTAS